MGRDKLNVTIVRCKPFKLVFVISFKNKYFYKPLRNCITEKCCLGRNVYFLLKQITKNLIKKIKILIIKIKITLYLRDISTWFASLSKCLLSFNICIINLAHQVQLGRFLIRKKMYFRYKVIYSTLCYMERSDLMVGGDGKGNLLNSGCRLSVIHDRSITCKLWSSEILWWVVIGTVSLWRMLNAVS